MHPRSGGHRNHGRAPADRPDPLALRTVRQPHPVRCDPLHQRPSSTCISTSPGEPEVSRSARCSVETDRVGPLPLVQRRRPGRARGPAGHRVLSARSGAIDDGVADRGPARRPVASRPAPQATLAEALDRPLPEGVRRRVVALVAGTPSAGSPSPSCPHPAAAVRPFHRRPAGPSSRATPWPPPWRATPLFRQRIGGTAARRPSRSWPRRSRAVAAAAADPVDVAAVAYVLQRVRWSSWSRRRARRPAPCRRSGPVRRRRASCSGCATNSPRPRRPPA
ncbi:hypothetical protein SANTM175S_06996 [Streptomyces antimycoticus]